VLEEALLQTLRKPELQPLGVKVRNKLDDIEDSNVGHGDDGGCEEALVRPLGNDLVSFGAGHAECQLASRIWGSPPVECIAEL
jgi:hypothetical protein